MHAEDRAGFFATAADLDPDAYLILDYRFECSGDPDSAAAHLCSEQSTAQWRRVDRDEDFRPRFAARVLDLEVIETAPEPSYAVDVQFEGPIHRCRVRIAHPHANFGPRLPNLISAVLGEGAFFAPGIPIIKLLDMQFPDAYLASFSGPQFGLQGLRQRWGIHDRPFFFGVIKPNIGLSPEPFAALAEQAWLGGLDIAKDDEMLADPDWSPLQDRARVVGAALHRAQAQCEETKVYLANITDEIDRLLPLHDAAVEAGADALLINALPLGLSALRMLRGRATVPLITHFPFIAAASRLPHYGVHSRVLTRLQRLAGSDAVIMPGFGKRMMSSSKEVRENINACLDSMGNIKASLPVPGGSDSAVTLEQVYGEVGHCDFGFVPGRGVFSHPMGPRGGAASLRQAWTLLAQGRSPAREPNRPPELDAAFAAFGG